MKLVCTASPFKIIATYGNRAAVEANAGEVILQSDTEPTLLYPEEGTAVEFELEEVQPPAFLADTGLVYNAGWTLPPAAEQAAIDAETEQKTAHQGLRGPAVINQLTAIIDAVDTATAAELRTAVKRLARNQRRIIQVLRKRL